MSYTQNATEALLGEFFAAVAKPSPLDVDMLPIAKVPMYPSDKAKLHLPSTNDIGVGSFYTPTVTTVGALSVSQHSNVEIPVLWYESVKKTLQYRLENFASYAALAGEVREVANRTKRDYIAQILHGLYPNSSGSTKTTYTKTGDEDKLYILASGAKIGTYKQPSYNDITGLARMVAEELKISKPTMRNFVFVCDLVVWQALSNNANFVRYDSFGKSQWETGFVANLGGCTVIVSNNLPVVSKTTPSSENTYALGANAQANAGLTTALRRTALLYYAPYFAKTAFNPMLKLDTRDIANSGVSMMACGGMASGASHGTVTPSRFLIMDDSS